MNNFMDSQKSVEKPQEQQSLLQPGEKAFQIILFAFGAFAFALSVDLWGRVSAPKASSAAALPIFVSGLWMVLSFIGIVKNAKAKTPLSNTENMWTKVKMGLGYALPSQTLFMIGAVIIYCFALFLKLNFYVATALFLYGSMCYLMRKSYAKNIIWTVILLLFIYLVFGLLFGVVFP